MLTFVAALTGVALAYGGLQALLVASTRTRFRERPKSASTAASWASRWLVAIVTGLIFALVPLIHLGAVKAAQAVPRSEHADDRRQDAPLVPLGARGR